MSDVTIPEAAGERIVAAAMIYNGVTCSLPAPARHGDIINTIAKCVPEAMWPISGPQGFVTDQGHFVDRQRAMQIAIASGQMSLTKVAQLFSEDLW